PATKSSGTPSAGDRQVVSAALCALCARTTLSILTQLNTERSLAPGRLYFRLSTVDCRPPTVVGFTTGNVEARSEPNRSPRTSSFFIRLGRPPQYAHRPHRSSRGARTNQ